jgi:hypothetical protein
VIIVDPNEIPLDVADDLDDDVREGLVGFDVAAPQVGVEATGRRRGQRHQIMQQGPQLLLAEPPVVPLSELGSKKDGAAPEAGVELERDDFLFLQGDVVGREAADVKHVDVVTDALLLVVEEFFCFRGKERGERERKRGGREVEEEDDDEERSKIGRKRKEKTRQFSLSSSSPSSSSSSSSSSSPSPSPSLTAACAMSASSSHSNAHSPEEAERSILMGRWLETRMKLCFEMILS